MEMILTVHFGFLTVAEDDAVDDAEDDAKEEDSNEGTGTAAASSIPLTTNRTRLLSMCSSSSSGVSDTSVTVGGCDGTAVVGGGRVGATDGFLGKNERFCPILSELRPPRLLIVDCSATKERRAAGNAMKTRGEKSKLFCLSRCSLRLLSNWLASRGRQ